MNIFNFFKSNNNSAFANVTSDGKIEAELNKKLSYENVRDIYLNNAVGERIVNLPIQLGLVGMKHNIPDEYNIKIEDIIPICEEYIRNVRLYGVGVLFPVLRNDDITKPLLKSELFDKDIRFNVTDPLNCTIDVNRDISSFSYMKVNNIRLNNGKGFLNEKRALVLTNKNSNLYLNYSESGMNYVGNSVFSNMFSILSLMNSAIVGIERMIQNSSALILKRSDAALDNNIEQAVIQEQARILKEIKLNSVVILGDGLDLVQMPIGNLDSIKSVIDNINRLLSLSSIDIPPQIWLGEQLSAGFSDGSEELTQLVIYLDKIRNNYIIPTVKFILEFLIYSKESNIQRANELVDNLEITFNNVNNTETIVDNSKELIEQGVLSQDDVKDQIEGR